MTGSNAMSCTAMVYVAGVFLITVSDIELHKIIHNNKYKTKHAAPKDID